MPRADVGRAVPRTGTILSCRAGPAHGLRTGVRHGTYRARAGARPVNIRAVPCPGRAIFVVPRAGTLGPARLASYIRQARLIWTAHPSSRFRF